AGIRRRIESARDQRPGLEVVGERNGAEILAERRTDAGGNGEHGCNSWKYPDVDRAPGRRAGRNGLAHRRRHGEYAGVAAGNEGNARTLGRRKERRRRTRALLAVVGGASRLAGTRGDPREIAAIAVERIGFAQRRARLLGQIARVAGPEP